MNAYEQMREAITKAEAVIDVTRMMVLQRQEYDLELIDFDGALKMLRAALALPRRQCDVGTEEEQIARYGEFCQRECLSCDNRHGCHICGERYRMKCMMTWAQTPYAAEEGAGK